MFTTYNCNLLLQFQVFDNVSRKDVFHARLVPFTNVLLSLSYTHTHALSSIVFFSSSSLINFTVSMLKGVARESQGASGVWKRQI